MSLLTWLTAADARLGFVAKHCRLACALMLKRCHAWSCSFPFLEMQNQDCPSMVCSEWCTQVLCADKRSSCSQKSGQDRRDDGLTSPLVRAGFAWKHNPWCHCEWSGIVEDGRAWILVAVISEPVCIEARRMRSFVAVPWIRLCIALRMLSVHVFDTKACEKRVKASSWEITNMCSTSHIEHTVHYRTSSPFTTW